MNTSNSGFSELWKSYSNILYFFGKPGEDQDIALIVLFLLGGALLIMIVIAFFRWRAYVEKDRIEHLSYVQSQDFPGTSGANPPATILYQGQEMGDWYELEASQVAQVEIQRRVTESSIVGALLIPEHLTLRQFNATPPPPYEELDLSREDTTPV